MGQTPHSSCTSSGERLNCPGPILCTPLHLMLSRPQAAYSSLSKGSELSRKLRLSLWSTPPAQKSCSAASGAQDACAPSVLARPRAGGSGWGLCSQDAPRLRTHFDSLFPLGSCRLFLRPASSFPKRPERLWNMQWEGQPASAALLLSPPKET